MSVFLTCTFTDDDATLIQDVVPDSGGTIDAMDFGVAADSTTEDATVLSNRFTPQTPSNVNGRSYRFSQTPPSAEYAVEVAGNIFTGSHRRLAIHARMTATGTANADVDRYSLVVLGPDAGNAVVLRRTVSGTTTDLDTHGTAFEGAEAFTLRLEISDAVKKGFLNDVEVVSSDDNTITQVGRVGIGGTRGHQDNWMDDLVAETLEEPTGPDAPTLAVTATSWDAVHVDAAAGDLVTDEINVYRSTTSPVTEEDTLVATFTPDGEAFDVELAAETEYFYRAWATNEEGSTPGTEQSATTFSDDAIETFATGDPIQFPLEIPAGQRALNVRGAIGKVVRALAGLGRAVDFAVTVDDEGETEIGSDTFLDVANADGGEPFEVALSPVPTGPQTLTVTITPTIEAEP